MTSLEQNLTWTAIRTDAIASFNGQTPRPEDEAAIIDVFEVHPQLVIRKIDELADAVRSGKVTWAWSALRYRLTQGVTPLREATADLGKSRTRAVQAAERWLENAGCHYDRSDHVEAELFGDEFGSRGILHAHADDQELRDRMLKRWRDLRPRGELAEQRHLEHSAGCVRSRERIAELKRQAARRTLEQLAARQA